MKKVLIALTPLLFFSFLLPKIVVARSGCCSHHGGVCSCSCCDGSPLSNTCAPYYPECSQPVYIAPITTKAPAIYTPTPRSINPPTPEPTSTPEPEVKGESINITPTPAGVTETTSTGSTVAELFALGVLGGLGYLGWKKIKAKFNKQHTPTV